MTFKEKSKTFITSETYSQVNLRNRKPVNLSTVQWKEEKNWAIVFHFPPQFQVQDYIIPCILN